MVAFNDSRKKPEQIHLFINGEDLPLFSGTAQRVKGESWESFDRKHNLKLFTCPVCFDTGEVKDRGKITPCICEASTNNKGE